mgnify:CR=1 FL=1
MNLMRPFGPIIAKFKIPDDIIADMNIDCEHVTNSDQLADHDMSSTLIGQINLQAQMSKYMLDKHHQWFQDRVTDYVQGAYKVTIDNSIVDAWYNRMLHPGEYNPQHIHPGCAVTSVGYLLLPEKFSDVETRTDLDNGVRGGLELFYGETNPLSHTQCSIIPVVGDYYIFPAVLRHTVYPMPEDLKDERRSFSINFGAHK